MNEKKKLKKEWNKLFTYLILYRFAPKSLLSCVLAALYRALCENMKLTIAFDFSTFQFVSFTVLRFILC